jgi:hypothetical protein
VSRRIDQRLEDIMSPRWFAVAGRALTLALCALAAANVAATEEASQASASSSSETRTVVAGKEFDRGGGWRFWFGEGYRKAWATPVELPVLDLSTEKGGLTPLRQVGGFQTEGLAFRGADGHGYTFRKLEKHPERVLPKEWQDSELRTVAVDQTSAAHPAATVVVGSLAQAVGIPFYASRLAVMPDDPALGEFRKTFGGAVGTLDEYLGPGTKGITEVVSTLDLWKKWKEDGAKNRVDARAFLKARLFDLVVGNWDRHQAQWRWARLSDPSVWVPLPEDADQAFTRYEGVAIGAARRVVPRFMRYSGDYPKRIEGLTANNYDVTRWLLARVEWPAYEEVARELAGQMTDAVIDEAMHRMPSEWYAIDGAQMTRDLRQRRDGIVAYARKFYEHLADPVDVRGTDQADLATVQHLDDGTLRLTLSPLGADGTGGAPYYERRFSPKETHEIRLYLLGGDDRVVATGANRDGIHLRVLGDDGNDSVDDSQSGGLDVQDPRGIAVRRGPGTKVSDHEWKNPAPEPDRPWLEPRNYGHWTVPMLEAWWQPNQAVMVGGGFTRTSWGFRKYPWASMQSFTLLYSTGYNNVRATYLGQWRLSDTSLIGAVGARWSGIENMNFYGFGNETAGIDDKTLYKTETNVYEIYPALRFQPGRRFELHFGPQTKVVQTKGGDSLVEQQQPYGSGKFGELSLRAGFEYDSRGRSLGMTEARGMAAPDATAAVAAAPASGVRIRAEGFFVPKAWDVAADFGGFDGSVAGYVGNQTLVLATQLGRRVLWGPYPWFESASISGDSGGIGGSGGVRGYYDGRFRGDSSLYGNAELRWWIGRRKNAVLPLRWGLTAFGGSGRVWYEGEDSKKWHTGYGGGLLVQLIGTPIAVGASLANGTEGLKFYFAGGYSF